MARFGFVGPTYQSHSINADCQRTVNWYPEVVESGAGKGPMALYPTPGLALFCALDQGPIWKKFSAFGRCFAIAGSGVAYLYEILSNGTYIKYQPNLGPCGFGVSVDAGATQLLMATGIGLYCFNFSTSSFQAVSGLALAKPAQVVFADGFFICFFAGTSEMQVSNAGDGSTWNALNVASVTVFADNLVGIKMMYRELWVWGPKRGQVYVDVGSTQFPYAPVPSGFFEQGLAAPATPCVVNNTMCWLGASERGQGIAWQANGYTPTRISNHAIEAQWNTYNTIADAVSYAYEEEGHAFWRLDFPTGNATWVYDFATNMWHERCFFQNAVASAHLARSHAFCFNQHLVGDFSSPKIYAQSLTTFQDNNQPIWRMRRAPHISSEQKWIQHFNLQVDMEVGYGIPGGAMGSAPIASLRWSNDGGNIWTNYKQCSAGAVGKYRTRVLWYRLGRARDRVYELTCTDPVPWRIIDAYLEATPTFPTPQERLATQLRKIA